MIRGGEQRSDVFHGIGCSFLSSIPTRLIATDKKADTFMVVLCLAAETLRVSSFLVAVFVRSLCSLNPTAGRGLRLYPEALS